MPMDIGRCRELIEAARADAGDVDARSSSRTAAVTTRSATSGQAWSASAGTLNESVLMMERFRSASTTAPPGPDVPAGAGVLRFEGRIIRLTMGGEVLPRGHV